VSVSVFVDRETARGCSSSPAGMSDPLRRAIRYGEVLVLVDAKSPALRDPLATDTHR
jgi:hypothetical protein